MTPKEKAEELVNKYYYHSKCNLLSPFEAKNCALIAVDEILESNPLEPNDTPDWFQPEDWFSDANINAEIYWSEVKKEIESL